VCEVPLASSAEARLREAASLPDVLDAGFAAFEAIRITARACEDQVPGLLAAFMTTADAAVDGREALTVAPSLPAPVAAALSTPCPQTPVPGRQSMHWHNSPPCCANVWPRPSARLACPVIRPRAVTLPALRGGSAS
jgi:hypothetical protein